jgi:hypothetical protein
MASYSVNTRAVARARELIDAHRYVLESTWGDVQPSAEDENAELESHSWDVIACQYRAAEWRHKDGELAAHNLLQHLDSTRA